MNDTNDPRDNTEREAIAALQALIQASHGAGESEAQIAKALAASGIPPELATKMVASVAAAERRQRWGALLWPLREFAYLVGAAVGIAGAAMLVSLVLGVVAALFNAINADFLGAMLVKFGGGIAGLGLGALGAAAAKESGSPGAIIGCLLGAVIYYLWLFGVIEPFSWLS